MSVAINLTDQLHNQALELSQRYKRAEADLICVLQQIEEHRVYLRRGHSSLFSYVTQELGLAENTAYSLITVARKAREVPELKAKLQAGTVTLSNARRVSAVLTPANQGEWLQKAATLSNRQLEREIIQVRPQEATPERTTYTAKDRVRLELGLSEAEILRLRRAQDLVCQSQRRAVSLEETLVALMSDYLDRHDPLEMAKRHRVRKGSVISTGEPSVASQTQRPTPNHATPNHATPNHATLNHATLNHATPNLTGPAIKEIAAPENRNSQTDSVNSLVTRRVSSKREPIPAAILHQVNWRDRRRCAHKLPNGTRCNQARWIEVHHIIPVSRGGENTIDNLLTLCSAHHKLRHLTENGG
jgi:hypothetical protein